MCWCGDDHDDVLSGRHIYAGGRDELTVTRREVLKGGVAAVAAAGAAAMLGPTLAAQGPGGAPAAQGPGGVGGARGGPIFWGNSGAGVDPASILAERQGPTRTTGLRFPWRSTASGFSDSRR
jgi:hypothetical protein